MKLTLHYRHIRTNFMAVSWIDSKTKDRTSSFGSINTVCGGHGITWQSPVLGRKSTKWSRWRRQNSQVRTLTLFRLQFTRPSDNTLTFRPNKSRVRDRHDSMRHLMDNVKLEAPSDGLHPHNRDSTWRCKPQRNSVVYVTSVELVLDICPTQIISQKPTYEP
jgi:hypothetical protein